MPMLENAGAYVWDARERDTHNFGVVVDHDGGHAQKGYHENNGKKKWKMARARDLPIAETNIKISRTHLRKVATAW